MEAPSDGLLASVSLRTKNITINSTKRNYTKSDDVPYALGGKGQPIVPSVSSLTSFPGSSLFLESGNEEDDVPKNLAFR